MFIGRKILPEAPNLLKVVPFDSSRQDGSENAGLNTFWKKSFSSTFLGFES